MLKREDIRNAKINRSIVTIMLLFAAAIAMIAMLLIWNGQITGFASLQTFESNTTTVTGSSPDGSLRFDTIPNFIARVGDHIRFDVEPNTKNVFFSDNSRFFEIGQEGRVEFTPSEEDVGRHNVWIIINDDAGRYYYQNVIIIIEE